MSRPRGCQARKSSTLPLNAHLLQFAFLFVLHARVCQGRFKFVCKGSRQNDRARSVPTFAGADSVLAALSRAVMSRPFWLKAFLGWRKLWLAISRSIAEY